MTSPSIEERIRRAVQRGRDAGVRFNGPATPSATTELEGLLRASLPDDYRAFITLHDGARPIGVADNHDLLSVAESIEELKGLQRLFREEPAGPVRQNPRGVAPSYWMDAWLPFTRDGGGSHRCLDLAPDLAAGGRHGQVIAYLHAEAIRPLLAPSFVAWLEAVEWTVDDD